MTLTKADLVRVLVDGIGLNKRESADMVDALFEEMVGQLEAGESLKLSGFGNFELLTKPERAGRNPKTGEVAPIKARRVVTFYPSAKLREHVCDRMDQALRRKVSSRFGSMADASELDIDTG